ncbi:MAG: hypothetical protein WKF75_17830 [Singulisphaera sp.]
MNFWKTSAFGTFLVQNRIGPGGEAGCFAERRAGAAPRRRP